MFFKNCFRETIVGRGSGDDREILVSLPASQARWVLANLSEASRLFSSAVANHRHKAGQLKLADPGSLLVPDGIAVVGAREKPFVVREVFVRGAHKGISVTYFGDDFLAWFGDMIVRPGAERFVQFSSLKREALDEEVLLALGGKGRAKTSIGDFYGLLLKQPTASEAGPLITDGRANFFYITDCHGALRAVACRRCGQGWYVFTCSITDWDRWRDGYRVFSQKRKEVV